MNDGWVRTITSTLVLAGMFWGYATAHEHRMTVLEENVRMLIEAKHEREDLARELSQVQNRVEVLERDK